MGKDSGSKLEFQITPDGITISKQDVLTLTRHESWEDIKEIVIRASESEIRSSDSTETAFPMEISNSNVTMGVDPEAEGESLPSQSVKGNQNDDALIFWSKVEDETGIRYYKEPDIVQFPTEKSASRSFTEFVELMFEMEILSRDDLPVESPNATKNYILNDAKVNKKGDEMPGAQEAVEGVFFENKTPKEHKERFVRRIAKEYAGV